MMKLHVCLVALVVLGTISRGEEQVGPFTDRAADSKQESSSTSSGPSSRSMGGSEFRVKGPRCFTVVYERVTANEVHINFATDKKVSLSRSDITDCAKKAAREGYEAFQFSDSCYGLRLAQRFLKNQIGSTTVYVRRDFLNDQATIVSDGEAPYKIDKTTFCHHVRVYMLSSFVGSNLDKPFSKRLFKMFGMTKREDGTVYAVIARAVEHNSCLNDGAYCVPMHTAAAYYNVPAQNFTSVYFLSECGKTILVPSMSSPTYSEDMMIYSHAGFGCTYYPSDVSEECTVTFKTDDSSERILRFAYILASPSEDKCGGFNMTVYGSTSEGAQPLQYDMCRTTRTLENEKHRPD